MNNTLESENFSGRTPGQILKEAREAGQVSISEVAQRLLLSKKVIAAIEEDDYSHIPAQVYAEGYLKAYAQFLKIPAGPILESFRNLNIYSRVEDKTEIAKPEQTNRWQKLSFLLEEQYRGYLVIGIFALLLLSLIIFFIGRHFFNKNAEIINVPNTADSSVINNRTVPSDQIPIVTTTSPEDATTSAAETVPKQKSIAKKAAKQNAKDATLMLDNAATEAKPNDDSEPKLILTPPKT